MRFDKFGCIPGMGYGKLDRKCFIEFTKSAPDRHANIHEAHMNIRYEDNSERNYYGFAYRNGDQYELLFNDPKRKGFKYGEIHIVKGDNEHT